MALEVALVVGVGAGFSATLGSMVVSVLTMDRWPTFSAVAQVATVYSFWPVAVVTVLLAWG